MIGLSDEEKLLSPQLREAVLAAIRTTFVQEGKRGSAEVLALEEAAMREANRAHRGIDAITDVLSFPAALPGEAPADGYWGDILLCPARAAAQAAEYGHSPERELAFLAVHGVLHLFGYDHETEEEERCMRQAQQRVMERMGLSR